MLIPDVTLDDAVTYGCFVNDTAYQFVEEKFIRLFVYRSKKYNIVSNEIRFLLAIFFTMTFLILIPVR